MQKAIVANWKMYKTIEEAVQFIVELTPMVASCKAKVMLAVPATALWKAAQEAFATNITIGAQNLDFHTEGAYTGEISAAMVKDAGACFTLVGHSERRRLFHESSEIVNLKAKAALAAGVRPLICVGETFDERKEARVEAVLKEQLEKSLEGISQEESSALMIAYEPVWAIGTGLTATPDDVYHAHRFCREVIAAQFGPLVAADVPILYGGSAHAENAFELLQIQGVDGLLVGRASLDVSSFGKIVALNDTLN